jgi:hypothetical protein
MTIELKSLSANELLSLSSQITQELRRRGILRTNNKPLGDYVEWLVSTKLNLTLAGSSNPEIDAVDSVGQRYQIKSRTIKNARRAKPLVQIRNLTEGSFDYLIMAYLNPLYDVEQCLLIPNETVLRYAKYSKHTNAFIFRATINLLSEPSIEDITDKLRG